MNQAVNSSFPIELDGPKSKVEQIAQALRAIPSRIPESEDAIPLTALIPAAAREIYLSWRRHEAPALKPSKWHKQFQTKAEGLLELLKEMPAELLEDVFQSREQKSQLYQRLVWALANSVSAPPHKPGSRTKPEPKRLAIIVANFYFNITGRPPTITRFNSAESHSGGDFLVLLSTIFRILEVKDKPRPAAEYIIKYWHVIDKAPGSIANVEQLCEKSASKNAE
jgi:hypothetical protein